MPGVLTVSARADEIGNNEGKVDCEIEGDASKIAFNSRYLQDVLNALSVEKVALEMTSPSSQGVFRPVGGDGLRARSHAHVRSMVMWHARSFWLCCESQTTGHVGFAPRATTRLQCSVAGA